MADTQEANAPESLNPVRFVAAALKIIAGLLALGAVIAVSARFWTLGHAPDASVPALVEAGVGFVAWFGFAMLMWGLAEILGHLDEIRALLRNQVAGVTAPSLPAQSFPRPRPNDVRSEAQTHLLEELVHLMREVRDIELLSEPERAARLRAEATELVQQMEREIPLLLREHNLQEARTRLQRARQRFPSLSNWDALGQQIEQTRAQFEAHDIELATREIDDLAALGAWDRATDVVRTLQQRHPEAEPVRDLARRVLLGQERATAEERARLMSQAQDATNRRDWPRALELVETLVSRFPGSAEVRELRQQLPTLQANVEIHKRQEMEATIRELVRTRRYPDALRIANELIERYPQSPQAAVLRDQLPRLQERLAQAAE
jgi:outer membrane protein assembly factor BamD (BamD/ComL family)